MAQADVPAWDPEDKTPYVYARLADHIQARITAGDYAVGDMLPNEREMVPAYGVSIDTVRRALAELRERGIVVTYPSRGTYVAKPTAELPRAPPRRVPARCLLDVSGCILSGPDPARGIPVASRPMNGEDEEEQPRIHLRNSERRYVQVADDLEARIRAGEFPYDAALPRREDLAHDYGVGEMTIRRATRVLADRGLVRALPSVGTIVIWAGHEEGT